MTLPGHRGRTVADVRDTSARSALGLGGPNGTGETRQLAGGLLAFGGAQRGTAFADTPVLLSDPTEWWHWSYGDRYWALMTGAPAALYGPVAGDRVAG
jgi:D-alanyl-D-alanine dipeptidase